MRNIGQEYLVWDLSSEGYEWIDAKALVNDAIDGQRSDDRLLRQETRFLRSRPNERLTFKRYWPLIECPGLYREFAALDQTERAFAKFANTYGRLGFDVWLDRGPGSFSFDDPENYGEAFYRWMNAHTDLRRESDIIVAIEKQDVKALRQWFRITNDTARYERSEPSGARMSSIICAMRATNPDFAVRPGLWKWATTGTTETETLMRIARGFAQEQINDALRGGRHSERIAPTSAQLLFNVTTGETTLSVVPKTLIAAMWLQCALAISTEKDAPRCQHCGKAISTDASDSRRADAKYCSNKCKVAAHRARNKMKAKPIRRR